MVVGGVVLGVAVSVAMATEDGQGIVLEGMVLWMGHEKPTNLCNIEFASLGSLRKY